MTRPTMPIYVDNSPPDLSARARRMLKEDGQRPDGHLCVMEGGGSWIAAATYREVRLPRGAALALKMPASQSQFALTAISAGYEPNAAPKPQAGPIARTMMDEIITVLWSLADDYGRGLYGIFPAAMIQHSVLDGMARWMDAPPRNFLELHLNPDLARRPDAFLFSHEAPSR